jgi:glycerol-3-phosphate acyltransferase PlsY
MGWGNPAIAVLVITLLLFYRHKSNLVKLVSGQESRIGGRS